MDMKLIAALACAAALALGACSGGNPPAGPTSADRGTPDAGPNGGTPDDDNGDSGPTAASLERQAKAAIDQANAAAAAGNSGDRPGARDEIENARKAIGGAVMAADAETKPSKPRRAQRRQHNSLRTTASSVCRRSNERRRHSSTMRLIPSLGGEGRSRATSLRTARP